MIQTFGYKIETPSGIIEGQTVSLSTRLVLQEAENRGISWRELPNSRVFELKRGNEKRYLHYQMPHQTLEIGFNICLNKAAAKTFLKEAGISTPKGYYIPQSIDHSPQISAIFSSLNKPLVVKPTHGKQGKSIFMGITTQEDLEEAVSNVMNLVGEEEEEGVLIEESFFGKEYRILATKEKVLGIINRIPANIVGNGKDSIQNLIDKKNSDPRRSNDIYDPLVKIPIDDACLAFLKMQNFDLSSIPNKDEQVFLRQNSNISTGGDSYDVTDEAHISVSEIALKVAQAIPGAYFIGIDFMTEDIAKPQSADSYTIIEVNGSPGLSIHDFPFIGKSRECAKELLFLIFPEVRE